jgi:hypothetical protein
MSHKYLNDIGIKSNDVCIFNTESIDKDKNRQKRFKKQRKEYGFDERETWSMDYTMATWIYSHFKAYKEYASKIVNLTYHKFNIPEWNEEENVISNEMIEINQEEAIDIVIKNIKFYLKYSDDLNKGDIAIKKFEYAFRIIGIIAPAMWW